MRVGRGGIGQRLARAAALVDGGQKTGDADMLAAGIRALREVHAIPDQENEERALCLHLLTIACETMYRLTSDLDDLEASVHYGDEVLVLLPEGHDARADLLARIGTHYRTLYEATSHLPFIDAGIDRQRRAAAAFTPGSPDRGRCRANQARAHLVRYQSHSSDADDLWSAVGLLQDALEDGLPDARQHAHCLGDLTAALGWLYDHTRDPQCLAAAIGHGEHAAVLLGPGQSDSVLSAALASAYHQRFKLTGGAADADASIAHQKAALAQVPRSSEQYAMQLTNLGLIYQSKYICFARPTDIDTAIKCASLAVESTVAGATERPVRVSYLANAYFLRGERVGSLGDLGSAIDLGEDAVAVAGPGHPDRGQLLSNLGAAYQERHELADDSADLRRARDLAEQALAVCREDDPARAARLWNLGTAHALLFLKTRNFDELVSAIGCSEQSLAVLPSDHPDEAPRLGNLCGYYRVKYEESLDQRRADLDKAVEYGTRGLALLSAQDVRRGRILAELGSVYALRFAKVGELPDFAEAEDCFENALAILPPDDSGRIAILAGLAEVYASRYNRSGGAADPPTLRRLAQGLTDMDTAPPWARVRMARAVGNVFLNAGETATAAGMFRTAVEALGKVASSDLEKQDRIHGVRGEQGLVSQAIAAYLDLDDAATAVEVAELGRGIAFSGKPNGARDPAGPHDAADTGAVVMLNFASRSDAVVLRGAETSVVPLTRVWWAEARRMIDKLGYAATCSAAERRTLIAQVLDWLWNCVTEPVFEALEYSGHAASPPRLWWVPVGIAGNMPLHAAQSSDGSCALDYAVSSYSPTVRSLVASRLRPAVRDRRQLTVAMQATPRRPDLRWVAEEARNPLITPEGSIVLRDGQASVEDVLAAIPQSTWLHFACHAANDHRDPLQSGLVLSNGRLSVAQISARTQDKAELAYLSACESAQSGAQHLDEVIHLGTAFQVAGFRHVIGTLWPVGDAAAAQVARDFYQHVADSGDGTADRAPHALHAAVRRLRSDKPDRPDLWASFTHLGP